MKRLFFDANVLFTAAHNPAGKAALVVELGAEGCWRLLTCAYAVEEARRNLEVKFPAALSTLDRSLRSFVLIPPGADAPFPAGLAPKDRPIFQGAWCGRATHLLTGDHKDFGAWMNRPDDTCGIVIQTVGSFLGSL